MITQLWVNQFYLFFRGKGEDNGLHNYLLDNHPLYNFVGPLEERQQIANFYPRKLLMLRMGMVVYDETSFDRGAASMREG
jgi:hypothetical protein